MAESMAGLKRTHRCTEVSEANIGQQITVMGWVQKSRNKGGIIFTDLRDRSGIIQIIFEEDSDYHKFLHILFDCQKKYDFDIYAYCLMSNHIHILINDKNCQQKRIAIIDMTVLFSYCPSSH